MITRCKICSRRSELKKKFLKDYYLKISSKEFSYSFCKKCNSLFQNPILSKKELIKYYPKNYYSYSNLKKEKSFLSKLRESIIKYGIDRKLPSNIFLMFFTILFSKKFHNILPTQKGNNRKFLDVGCGSGDNLVLLSKYGWKCYGLEIDKTVVNEMKKNNLNVSFGDISVIKKNNYFDVIRLWHVLEHMPDASFGIKKIKNLLKKDGTLYLAVPNYNSFARFIFRKYWIGYDAPRHTYVFSNLSITALFKENGFKIEKIRYSSSGGFAQSFDNMINDIFKTNIRFFSTTLGIILFYPFDLLSDLFKRGDIIFLKLKIL